MGSVETGTGARLGNDQIFVLRVRGCTAMQVDHLPADDPDAELEVVGGMVGIVPFSLTDA